MVGYPSIDLNDSIRKHICIALDEKGLKYRKYTNNIIHSTIVRASENIDGLSSKLLQIANNFKDKYFGELTVDNFEMGISSWRMQEKELKRIAII